jgi:hypothetical protein
MLDVELLDRFGNRPVRLRFDEDGRIKAMDGSAWKDLRGYDKDAWYEVGLGVEAGAEGRFGVSVDGAEVLKDAALAEAVRSVERVCFRTGAFREEPTRESDTELAGPPLKGADEPVAAMFWNVRDVRAAGGGM